MRSNPKGSLFWLKQSTGAHHGGLDVPGGTGRNACVHDAGAFFCISLSVRVVVSVVTKLCARQLRHAQPLPAVL